MILYHCSYIDRTGEICGRGSKSERCYIHRKSPVYTPCRDCGELNRSCLRVIYLTCPILCTKYNHIPGIRVY